MSIRTRILLITGILIPTLFSGCASSSSYYLDPQYKEQRISTTLMVLPVQREWFSKFYEHNFGYVSGRNKMAFYSLLNPLFSEYSSATVITAGPDKTFDESYFKIDQVSLGETQMKTVIPTEQSDFVEGSSRPTFVLILDQFYFQKQVSSAGGSSYAGHERNSSSQELLFQTNYLYWDNNQKKPVAWGTAESKISFVEDVTFPKYSELLSIAFKKIIDQGPISGI